MHLGQLSFEVFAAFGGIQVVLTTLLGLLGKVWLSRAMDREKVRLETSFQKRLYMEKTQFDTELTIYRELWKELCEVRKAGWDFKRDSGNRVSITMRNGDDFRKAANGLQYLVEVHRPFFAPTIAELLFILLKTIDEYFPEEHVEEHKEPQTLDDAIRGFPTSTELADHIDYLIGAIDSINDKTSQVCEAIRVRLFPSRDLEIHAQ